MVSANPALMLFHREPDGTVVAVPFTYRDGRLFDVIEPLTEYLASIGPEAVWEAIAADHLRNLLLYRQRCREQATVIERQEVMLEQLTAAMQAGVPALQEAAS